jgi:WhiB family redox-sensing transcriptional regulator
MFNTEGAACIGLDPELFFPTNNISPKIEDLLKKTCLRCPIFDACLDYSLKVKVDGWWAGTSDKERVQLRRFFGITPIRIDQQLEREHRSITKETGAR